MDMVDITSLTDLSWLNDLVTSRSFLILKIYQILVKMLSSHTSISKAVQFQTICYDRVEHKLSTHDYNLLVHSL